VYGLLINSSDTFFNIIIFLVGIWIVKMLSVYKSVEALRFTYIGLILSMLLLVRVGFPPHEFRVIGDSPEEKAILYLTENYSKGDKIAAESPRNVVSAKMNFVDIQSQMSSGLIGSKTDLINWIIDQKLNAIYLDASLREAAPEFVSLVIDSDSTELVLDFSDAYIQVYRVNLIH
jgi:hypothetical protein